MTVSAVTFVPNERASGDPNTPSNESAPERFERRVNRTTVDLTTVDGDSAAFVDTVRLPVREQYTSVVLTLSVEDATLTSGDRAEVTVPGGTLNASAAFPVEPGSNATLLLDLGVTEENGTYTLTSSGVETGVTPTTSTAQGASSGGSSPTETTSATASTPTEAPAPTPTATPTEG